MTVSLAPTAVVRPVRLGRHGAPLLVMVLTASLALWAIEPWPVGVFQDDGIYAILGKALASGEGYRYLNLPGEPAATHYPPGYPLLLALLWRFSPEFPANSAVFVFANVGFLAMAAAGTWYFAHRRLGLGESVAALTALATVACVPALMFGVFVLSEPMFMALLIPVLLASERAVDSGTGRDAAIAGCLGGVLALVRTMGQFVIPALVLMLLLRRRWSAAVVAALAAATILLPWQLWISQHGADVPLILAGKYGSYGGWLAGAVGAEGPAFLVQVAWRNVSVVVGMIWEMLGGPTTATGVLVTLLSWLAAAAVLAILAAGAPEIAARAPVTLVFIIVYVAVAVAWPFQPTRFLWALLPVIGAMAALGARAIVRWHPERAYAGVVRLGAIAAVALLGAAYMTWNARALHARAWTAIPRSFAERATPLVEWARAASHPDDLLATDDDALVHLYSGRRTIPVGTFTPQEYLTGQSYDFAATQLEALLREFEPRYVLCGSAHCVMAASRLMNREPPRVRLIATLQRGAVFERVEP